MKPPGKLRSGTEVHKKNNRLQSRKHKQELPFFFVIACGYKNKKTRTGQSMQPEIWPGLA